MNASESPIWFRPVTVERLNALSSGTLMEHLGIRYTEIGSDYLRATMPVDHTTKQPFGLLHGGATAALAESVVSAAASCVIDLDRYRPVGIELSASHVRSASSGTVTCTARPVRLGASMQVWRWDVEDEDGRIVSAGRLTVAVLAAGR